MLLHKTYNKRTLQVLFTSKSSAQLALTLLSDVVLKLSRLFQTATLTDWTLCYEQSLIFHCVTLLHKVNNLLSLLNLF